MGQRLVYEVTKRGEKTGKMRGGQAVVLRVLRRLRVADMPRIVAAVQASAAYKAGENHIRWTVSKFKSAGLVRTFKDRRNTA